MWKCNIFFTEYDNHIGEIDHHSIDYGRKLPKDKPSLWKS